MKLIRILLLLLILGTMSLAINANQVFVKCPYGESISQPMIQCPGFRIRITDRNNKFCYLSLGRVEGAGHGLFKGDTEKNVFWDCESSGAKWKLLDIDGKLELLTQTTDYLLQVDPDFGQGHDIYANERNLKADKNGIVASSQDISGYIFESDGYAYHNQGYSRCYLTHSSDEAIYKPSEYYSYGNEYVVGYEGKTVCNNALGQGAIIEYVYDGESEPIPGKLTSFELPNGKGSGTIRLSEKTNYMHPGHTLDCNIEIDDLSGQLLDSSYITISNEMYESLDTIEEGGFLIASSNVISSMPAGCVTKPTLKITTIEFIDTGVKLFVTEAAFFEYMPVMDVDLTNLEVYDNGIEADTYLSKADDITANNPGIKNVKVALSEFKECGEYDEFGELIPGTTFPAVNGTCDGKTIFEDMGSTYGENGFEQLEIPQERRRLIFGKIGAAFRSAVHWVADKTEGIPVIGTITGAAKTVVDVIAGDVDEMLFEKGLKVGFETGGIEITGGQELAGTKSTKSSSNQLTVNVDGTFKLNAGAILDARAYVNLKAKYDLWSGTKSFDLFRFVVGTNIEAKAWLSFEIQGGVTIDFKIWEKTQQYTTVIVVVPIVYDIHGTISAGIDLRMTVGLSAQAGIKPIGFEYGVEYTSNGGWKPVKDENFEVVPYAKFGGKLGDKESCGIFAISPYITFNIGIRLYKALDLWLEPTVSLPMNLLWPGTCNDNYQHGCQETSPKLRFEISTQFGIAFGVTVAFKIGGWQIGPDWTKSWSISGHSIPLYDTCVDLSIPSLEDICCINGEIVPLTRSPTKNPTERPTSDTSGVLINNIGSKNYQQCLDVCQSLGLKLASMDQVINYLDDNGGAFGGDSWTPVIDTYNQWLQIGGDGPWQYGLLHTDINGGTPSWGTSIESLSYKKVFFCYGSISFDITEYSIGSRNYAQCTQACKDTGGVLANRGQVLNYLDNTPKGGDSWTPVVINNDWLQIGGNVWRFALLHTEIGSGIKPSWGTSTVSSTYKQTFYCYNDLQEYDIGTKNYAQCAQFCKDAGSVLATKDQIMAYLDLPKGGDIWTPVYGDNDWLQIGGSIWSFGLLHSDLNGGTAGKPSWGTQTGSAGYKDTFYCTKDSFNLIGYDIGTKNYAQCVQSCEDVGGVLATKAQIMDYLVFATGGDSWTPVIDTYNDWLQIGGSVWTFGLLHTDINGGTAGTPSWGTQTGARSYKQVFYCNV